PREQTQTRLGGPLREEAHKTWIHHPPSSAWSEGDFSRLPGAGCLALPRQAPTTLGRHERLGQLGRFDALCPGPSLHLRPRAPRGFLLDLHSARDFAREIG